MINIEMDESVNYNSGIYLIEFSNGYFYIGSAKCIKERVKFHCRCILSNFKNKTKSCMALTKMKDFSGSIKISVIEYMEVESRIYASRYDLLRKEHTYVIAHRGNEFLLNYINSSKK